MPRLATIAPFGFSFDPERTLAAYRSLGATTCQYFANRENPPTVERALRAARISGVPFDSIHGVFGADIDPSSPDAEHRRRCVRIYEDEGRLARDLVGDLGDARVVVHPAGWTPGRRTLSRDEAAASDARRRPMLAVFMRDLAEVGERLGVVYLIENKPFNVWAGFDPAGLARDVLAVGSPRVRICLDTGHAHVTTGDVAGAIRAAAPAIDYLHLHDNDGAQDDHRMPGDGTIRWNEVGAAMRESGLTGPGDGRAVAMLEVFYDEARVEALARERFGQRLLGMIGA